MSETEKTITIPIRDAALLEKATAHLLALGKAIEHHFGLSASTEAQRAEMHAALRRTQVALVNAGWTAEP